MVFKVLTIFPELIDAYTRCGMMRRALAAGIIDVVAIDIRQEACDRHKTVDDRPFGGGPGMVMKPEPLAKAVARAKKDMPQMPVVLMSPRGRPFEADLAKSLSSLPGLILLCGRYEGVDERICRKMVDLEISIGDYVLTGGELAALVVMDATCRMLPGFLGAEEAAHQDSFSEGFLEHPHFTRPADFEGEKVPEILLSGNHQEISRWRHESSMLYTLVRRKDLFYKRRLDKKEMEFLTGLYGEIGKIIAAQHSSGTDSLPGD